MSTNDPNEVVDPNVDHNKSNPNTNKNSFPYWLLGLILLLLLIFLLFYWKPWASGDNDNNKKAKTDSITALKAEKEKTITAYNDQLKKNQADLDKINAEKALLVLKLEYCEKTAAAPAPALKPRPKRNNQSYYVKPRPTQRVIVEIVNKTGNGGGITAQQYTPRASTTKIQSSQPANYNTETSLVDKTSFTREISEKKLCFRFGTDARGFNHWPHLGAMDGMKYPELVDNKQGGFDLMILPSGSIGDKDYGIAADGTRYIRMSLINKYIKLYDGKSQGINDFGYFVDIQIVGDFAIIPADGNVFTNNK